MNLDKVLEFYTLKNLIRYNNRTRIKNESVAEHSFFVALFTLIICDELQVYNETRCWCLIYSLLHDISEIYIGDIPHSAKTEFKELKNVVNEIDEKIFNELFSNHHPIKYVSGVKEVVELADILSVIQYVECEKRLGNSSMIKLEEVIDRYFKAKQKVEEIFGKKIKYFDEE